MFNMYTKLGKLYVFDIQRTYREVYDHARRVLHAKGVDVSAATANTTANLDLESSISMHPGDLFGAAAAAAAAATVNSEAILHKMEKEVAERITEAITCRICMDREIDTSFTPCGHITSCSICAQK